MLFFKGNSSLCQAGSLQDAEKLLWRMAVILMHFQVFSYSHFQDMWLSCISFYSAKTVLGLNTKVRKEGNTERSLSAITQAVHFLMKRMAEAQISLVPYTSIPTSLSFVDLETCHPRKINPLRWNKGVCLKSGVTIDFNRRGKDRTCYSMKPWQRETSETYLVILEDLLSWKDNGYY